MTPDLNFCEVSNECNIYKKNEKKNPKQNAESSVAYPIFRESSLT